MKNEPGKRITALAERSAKKTELICLPACPDSKRGTPNAFLRSALFSAIQSKDRVHLQDAVLASQCGVSIKFTGMQLNQEDLTLWETLVHLAKDSPLGSSCEFTAYQILKAMGLCTGSSDQEMLKNGITRLIACSVKICINDKRAYETSLVISSETDSDTGRYNVELSKQLIKLYAQSTWVDWDQRIKLRRKPLAQALHGYYSSHQKPYGLKIDTVKQLTGSKNKQAASFKRQVVAALDELVDIGFLKTYEIIDDKIHVKKT
jgi:hypothetical protein